MLLRLRVFGRVKGSRSLIVLVCLCMGGFLRRVCRRIGRCLLGAFVGWLPLLSRSLDRVVFLWF